MKCAGVLVWLNPRVAGLAGGVLPLRTALMELDTLVNESPDSFRCHGALPKSLRPILEVWNSSLNHVPVLLMF